MRMLSCGVTTEWSKASRSLNFALNSPISVFSHPKETSIETATADVLQGALVGPKAKRRRMNRRDIDYAALNGVGPFDFEFHWFNRAILRKGKSTGEYQALRNLLDQWMGVRLYRDGFRVYPYGSGGG